ncbi:MAG: type VI secretion system baseplate subunit TssK [Betaproteobacteria bacterium]|jgi:type VI secretion system protein ImpJ|nr:type VI secretion system baseplate subunit TssK [Burkholderiaceae bacterium]MCZ8112171.1 type VI secretion system baseplate subunit TssK [Rubrivivax sp.]MCZ8177207.1 type VI secretion system baseplate subunit TssK [Burkholderiaceae bacterium]
MTWHNKVMWTEGMFLQPQHFQQQDRFVARQLDSRFVAGLAWPWGFSSLQFDDAALLQGKVMITAARGVMPDGLAFAVPADDPAPPAFEVPADARDQVIVLAAPQARPGVTESDVEGGETAMSPRWRVADIEAADVHATSLREAPVQVGRLNLRLMLARDAGEGYAALGAVRVVERRADGRVLLDNQYVPPMLHAPAHVVLDSHLREVHGMLHQRGDALGARLAQPGRAGIGEIVDFLLLQAVNRHQPLFAHLQRLTVLHPERLYELCLGLAGELSTFREARRPVAFPEYRHDDLAGCFRAVMADLRQSLSMVMEQTAIPIDLQERKYGIRVAIISDVELLRNAMFVLAVNAQMPGEALRARFPTQVKIGPAERIRDLVNLQLPGVTLRALPVAPRQIPYHAGFTYFELETRGNELWKQLETSGGLAMAIAGEFPGLALEFWAIRG